MAFEATYIAQVLPGFALQPDIQYIVRPSGHILNPRDPGGREDVRNALVLGLRTVIRY